MAHRSFHFSKGKRPITQTLDEPIQCYLRSKTLDWHTFRIVRVPPLKIFSGTSRPMRSQHFELSTNQKALFWADFWWWPDIESTNPMQMCQLTDHRVSLESQLNANVLPIECKLTANQLAIVSQVTSYQRWITTIPNIANGTPIDHYCANWPNLH